MNNLIGRKQSVTLIFFLAVPQLLINYISYGISKHNSGYWINYIICSIISFLLILFIKNSFNKKINIYVDNSKTEKIIKLIFMFYIFALTLYNFNICINATLSVTSKIFSKDIVLFLPVISAVICSVMGIEAIGRLSYIIFYLSIGIVFFICIVTLKGWQNENLYPLLGTSVKSTLFDFVSCGVFAPAFTTYLIRDSFVEPGKTFDIIKKVYLYVFVSGMFISMVCILSVPNPMINFYDFSLAAIFSAAKSNVFFHRFELMLVFLLMIINTMSLSVGLYVSSKTIADLSKAKDFRPFSSIIGFLFFYISLILTEFNIVLYIYIGSALLLYVFFIIKSCILIFKNKNTKRVRH